jgi:hypothetical protein
VRLEVLTAVLTTIQAFLGVTLCCSVISKDCGVFFFRAETVIRGLLFIAVLGISSLRRPQQTALTDNRFYRASHCSTARQNLFKETVAPSIARLDISKFISLRLPEGDSVHYKPRTIEALKYNILLEIPNIAVKSIQAALPEYGTMGCRNM